jgi:AcrR family transcriptional regulator
MSRESPKPGHENEKTVTRKPRADAERNRQLLLDTAKTLFEAKGSSAGLEEIARQAGVGIGTLYRHFPTRDELVVAVYRNETEQLAAAATQYAETLAPVDALRAWLRLFIDHMATKQGMSEALNSLVGGTSALYAASTDLTKGAMQLLVDRAVASGDIRLSTDPLDLLRAIAGVMSIGSAPQAKESARRMVDVLIAGIRTTPVSAAARVRARRPAARGAVIPAPRSRQTKRTK